MNREVLILGGRHRPHELLLLAISVVIGAAYLIGSPPPGSLTALLLDWQVYAWSTCMLVSGALGLLGCVGLFDITRALQVERGALVLQSGGTILYSVAIFNVAGGRALIVGLIAAAWTTANLVRAWQIGRELPRIRKVCGEDS